MKKLRLMTAVMAALLFGAVVTAPSANAAPGEQASNASPSGKSHSQKPVKGGPLDLSDPNVAAHDAKIRKSGVKVLSATTSPFVVADASEKKDKENKNSDVAIAPMIYPSGCGLSVWVYQDGGRIISSNLTSCPFTFSTADMDSWLGFYAWFSYNRSLTDR